MLQWNNHFEWSLLNTWQALLWKLVIEQISDFSQRCTHCNVTLMSEHKMPAKTRLSRLKQSKLSHIRLSSKLSGVARIKKLFIMISSKKAASLTFLSRKTFPYKKTTLLIQFYVSEIKTYKYSWFSTLKHLHESTTQGKNIFLYEKIFYTCVMCSGNRCFGI